MSKEAMKLALEALESLKVTVSSRTEANVIDGVDLFPTQIAALRKALANEALDKIAENARELGLDYEPAQQEPVAWMREGWGPDCGPYIEFYRDDEMGWRDRKEWTALYTSPPAQRTWVGLTDEELYEIYNKANWDVRQSWDYERAIEAKIKEKNQ